MLKVDLKYAFNTGDVDVLSEWLEPLKKAHQSLINKSGKGAEFLGWYDLPKRIQSEVKSINQVAETIIQKADVFLVIGIGGSYLGAKAVIEALKPYFNHQEKEIIFVGHHISAAYIQELKTYLMDKKFAINVISKSGTTTEPAIAFRVFKALLETQIGKDEAKQLIVATTDEKRGALKQLADQEGYQTFVIPDDVGGRYSVFTAVGLLPIALAGIDIEAFLSGAEKAFVMYQNQSLSNPVYQYVAMRNIHYAQGKKIEMLIGYEPKLHYVSEWWKQLFGESEGKDHKGLFVGSANFTTDLHSLGQYIQDGQRVLFETVLNIETPLDDFNIPYDEDNLDGLNFLTKTSVDTINKQAMLGTLMAHQDGLAPSIVLHLNRLDAEHLGHLLYFFELSCALSGYLIDVNPFDQPGVEAYKKNMFALLEKPGFELETQTLKKRLK